MFGSVEIQRRLVLSSCLKSVKSCLAVTTYMNNYFFLFNKQVSLKTCASHCKRWPDIMAMLSSEDGYKVSTTFQSAINQQNKNASCCISINNHLSGVHGQCVLDTIVCRRFIVGVLCLNRHVFRYCGAGLGQQLKMKMPQILIIIK